MAGVITRTDLLRTWHDDVLRTVRIRPKLSEPAETIRPMAVVVIVLAVPNLPSLDALTGYQPKVPLRIYTVEGVPEDVTAELAQARAALQAWMQMQREQKPC